MEYIRTALFVPGTRIDRIEKAIATGADAVIVDLEDAVAAESKEQARQALADFLVAHPQVSVWVRINGIGTPWFTEDLAFCAAQTQITAIMLPKASSAGEVEQVAEIGKPVYPIIESAQGIVNIPSIAAVKGVVRLSFGALDLGVDLGLDDDSEGAQILLNQMRVQMVVQSRAAGIAAPLDGVYPDFKNLEGIRQAMTLAKGMGFAGALCIHPTQVEIIHQVMQPKDTEVAWAKAVLAKAEETGLAAFAFEGKMVDLPVFEKARQILHRAG
ncbi:HpcH/HpaI aldolase/citrate lyase family protein [Pelistega suis]|uniref:HpcH/HpaI aldolase/citrate lyase family protein n=1 Tax=Pelistega suis TaxID=1631957 RepID=UPI00211C8C25|nr:CoA ester lyase [Pelistega suis]MCQ9329485.1 CoA ester lyase [Pelistega suis]